MTFVTTSRPGGLFSRAPWRLTPSALVNATVVIV
jgi:hypothetical protein